MPARKLSDPEIAALLPKMKGWSVVNGKLHREITCKDFVTAFGNMTRVALVAESMNQLPVWCNVWNLVLIVLMSLWLSRINAYDFKLALRFNAICADFAAVRRYKSC